MIVLIPGLLRSYTNGAERVAVGPVATLGDALDALDARYAGMRFRIVDEQGAIRRHIRIFVDGRMAPDLGIRVAEAREVMIVGALSGG